MDKFPKGDIKTILLWAGVTAASIAGIVWTASKPEQTRILLLVLLSLGIVLGLVMGAYNIYATVKDRRNPFTGKLV